MKILTGLAGLCLLTACSLNSPETIEPEPLRLSGDLYPDLISDSLDNGFTYRVLPLAPAENRETIAITWRVGVGSLVEEADQQGAAHFVEHMAFRGAGDFERDQLVSFFEQMGMDFGRHLNAYTGFEETVYTLTLPRSRADELPLALDVIHAWATDIHFDPELMERERGVVLEEWRLSETGPASISDYWIDHRYRDSRYVERYPIGQRETIERISPEALRAFHARWYQPHLMELSVVGAIEGDRVVDAIHQRFASLPTDRSVQPVPGDVPERTDDAFLRASHDDVAQFILSLEWPTRFEPESLDEAVRSPLYDQLLEVVVNDRLRTLRDHDALGFWESDFYHLELNSVSGKRALDLYMDPDDAEDTLHGMVSQLQLLVSQGISEDEWDSATEQLFTQGRGYLNGLAHASAEELDWYLQDSVEAARDYPQPIRSPDQTLVMYRDLLADTTVDDFNHWLAAEFALKPVTLGVSGSDSLLVDLDEETLWSVLDAALAQPEAQYPPQVASVNRDSLEDWTQGEVVSMRTVIPDTLYEWELSNGVHLLFQATDTGSDDLRLDWYAQAGISHLSPELWPSARFYDAVLVESGLLDHDGHSLDRMLSRENIGLSSFLDFQRYQVSVQGDVEQSDQLTELLRAAVQAPDLAQSTWDRLEPQVASFLRNYLDTPAAQWDSALVEAIWSDDARMRTLDDDELAGISAERMASIHDALLTAGDFLVVVSGDLTEQELTAMAESIAGIPVQPAVSAAVPFPQSVQAPRLDRAVHSEDKTELTMMWFWPDSPPAHSRSDEIAGQLLQDLLGIHLRNRLREELGLTYGIHTYVDQASLADQRWTLEVQMTTDPEEADRAEEEITQAITAFLASGVSDEALNQAKDRRRERLTGQISQPGDYHDRLSYFWQHNLALEDYRDFAAEQSSVTAQQVMQWAERLINAEDTFVGLKRPQN